MSNFLISLISIVVVLGVMILVHEWGHFIVARMCGVRVDVFSVGMGPRIWGMRRGATDYRLSAFPIGGYVRMAGENPSDERTGAPDEFLSKKRWQRALIILAGPAMNILMALVIATGMFMTGRTEPAYLKSKAEVSGAPQGSPAAKAGIRAGDVLVEVNGKRVRTWDDASWQWIFTAPNATIPVTVERDSQRVPMQVKRSPDNGLSDLFGYPTYKTVILSVEPGKPAAEGGLKADDEIVSIAGKPALSPFSVSTAVTESEGKPVPVTVIRNGQTVNLTLHPTYGELAGAPTDQKRWYIGAYFKGPATYRDNTFGAAVRGGVRYNVMLTSAIVNMVFKLVERKAQLKQLSGPVGIAKVSGQAAREGPIPFLNVMAVISLNLGILNLLPIPILDGWHILTLGVEGTIRRDLSLAVKERALQVGLVFLLLLILIVTYNDVLKLIIPSH